jgi:DNA-binding transcriptional LysR family regulator
MIGAGVDWDDLKIFLEVAERGTMGAAARALDLAQPTISQRVRQLETQLGVQLLVRRTSGVALTEAGARVRAYDAQLSCNDRRQ